MTKTTPRLATVASCVVIALGLVAVPSASRAAEPPEIKALQGRTTAPKAPDIDAAVTLEGLLKSGPADLSQSKGATVEGYVIMAEREEDGDVVLFLAAKPDETSTTNWVIVEVPPHWQGKSSTLSRKELLSLHGKKVEVTGWLFFDPDGVDPRGTKWEIHPVTSIKAM